MVRREEQDRRGARQWSASALPARIDMSSADKAAIFQTSAKGLVDLSQNPGIAGEIDRNGIPSGQLPISS